MPRIEKQNKALVRRIYEDMWNKGDVSVASEIFVRPEGVERFMREFLTAFPGLHHSVEELIAEGDRLVARFSAEGMHTGPWKQYAPSGKAIHYTGVTVAQIKGDKIIHHRTWWDTMELVEQIRGENS
ncbi:MAG: hypothetical protein EHM70_12755 [Chloroflexota bacterium]|nr:MAG: hypothetical protein EHM70_12755 [Chloroflexota bacterium]